MSKPKIVLADTDEKYLEPLVNKFIDELAGMIELEVISDREYFKEYFSIPQRVDMLIVNQEMYSQELQKQNMKCICILTEQTRALEMDDPTIKTVYKYGSMKEIFHEIIHEAGHRLNMIQQDNIHTQIITICSGIGGVGKTSIALSLSEYLAKNHRKVLFISAESLQSFRFFLQDKRELSKEACFILKENPALVYQKLKQFLRTEVFDYLPPFSNVLPSLNLSFSLYKNLILNVADSKEYEFIIIDTQTGYTEELMNILEISDHIIVAFLQDELSKEKNTFLLKNIKYDDREKYIFVCNQYNKELPNALEQLRNIEIAGYIEYNKQMHGKKLTELQGMHRLGYMFL